ncbi:MAG: hypothetical protein BWY26_00142 [Elusimicrobia bacterium ADurb.Bin231]|nr:MAG: hypothetical protein BWY26_00142 [Elusimicrobia bacterium ADurb.Bin231]
MKFPCYALILCLNLIIPVFVYAQQPETPAPSSPSVVGMSLTDTMGNPLPGTEITANTSNQERQSVLTNLLSKLLNSYNELNSKYMDLSEKYEKLQSEVSAGQTVQPKVNLSDASDQDTQPDKESLSARAAEITTFAEAQALVNKVKTSSQEEQIKGLKEISDHQTKKNVIAASQGSDSQYVKLRLLEDGQEVEFLLDPMYVDMNFNFTRQSSSAASQSPQPQVVIERKEIISSMPERSERQPGSLPQQQYQPQPQYYQQYPPQTTVIMPQSPGPYQQPYIPQQRDATDSAEKKQERGETAPQDVEPAKSSAQQQFADTGAIDGIYKSQKLYYEKRYREALFAVQTSIRKQPTALGYALQGSLYYTLGDMASAVASWQMALDINPDMPDVKLMLNKYRSR